jgi:hypothetical protein
VGFRNISPLLDSPLGRIDSMMEMSLMWIYSVLVGNCLFFVFSTDYINQGGKIEKGDPKIKTTKVLGVLGYFQIWAVLGGRL